MALLIGCFVAAMLFIISAAEVDKDDEMADEAESRMWINALADESQRRTRRHRSKYSVSGLQK